MMAFENRQDVWWRGSVVVASFSKVFDSNESSNGIVIVFPSARVPGCSPAGACPRIHLVSLLRLTFRLSLESDGDRVVIRAVGACITRLDRAWITRDGARAPCRPGHNFSAAPPIPTLQQRDDYTATSDGRSRQTGLCGALPALELTARHAAPVERRSARRVALGAGCSLGVPAGSCRRGPSGEGLNAAGCVRVGAPPSEPGPFFPWRGIREFGCYINQSLPSRACPYSSFVPHPLDDSNYAEH